MAIQRKTQPVAGGDTGLTTQYNSLRDEAQGSAVLLAQGTNTLKVFINDGLVYFGTSSIEFVGSECSLLANTAASSRIDVISLQATNSLMVTAGVEDDAPTTPVFTDYDLPICSVYIRHDSVLVNDTDIGSNAYIYKDLRPFLIRGEIGGYVEKTASRALDATVYQNTSNRWLSVAISARLVVGTASGCSAIAYIGATSSPATAISKMGIVGHPWTGNSYLYKNMSFLVPPNWYYCVTTTTSGVNDKYFDTVTWWEGTIAY